jgi:predicted ester cyclase
MHELANWYRRYNECCNAHLFDDLAEFVDRDVVVNGTERGLDAYIAGLRAVVTAFPDYRWELRHLIVDEPWIAAHFADTGTHRGTFLDVSATGRAVHTQEFAFYRVDRRIVEVWVTADNLRLLEQLGSEQRALNRRERAAGLDTHSDQ